MPTRIKLSSLLPTDSKKIIEMKLYLIKKFNTTPYIQSKDLLWIEYIQIITGGNFSAIKTVCDINCGNGKMLCALAALYPQISFSGICLKENDLKNAEEIKTALNLSNIQFFYSSSINEFSKFGIPPQNLVYINDMWNFCDEQDKLHLIKLTDSADITIVSYDALPGQSAMIPIHYTLINGTQHSKKDLHYINQHYGTYFQAHPVAGALLNEDINRYAHPKWHPQSVAQVSKYFNYPLKGEFPVYRNYPYVSMSKKEKELFTNIKDPLYFSTLRDYAFNTTKRTDIYAKTSSKNIQKFSDLSFGQINSQQSFPDKSSKGRVTFFYKTQIFADIFEATKHGFICCTDLAQKLPQYSDYELKKALHELIAGEELHISLSPLIPTLSNKITHFTGKIKFLDPFNKYICNTPPLEGNIFIVPETKIIIPIKGIECALLQALTKVNVSLAPQLCAENYIKENPKNHLMGKDYKQVVNNFLLGFKSLKETNLPKLLEMNVIELIE